MRISRSMVLVAGAAFMVMPALADEAACMEGQCAVLADNVLISEDAPRFVAEVPLPPARSQTVLIARQKATPRIILAAARISPAVAAGAVVPPRDVPRLTSFWLTVGTGF